MAKAAKSKWLSRRLIAALAAFLVVTATEVFGIAEETAQRISNIAVQLATVLIGGLTITDVLAIFKNNKTE